MNSVLIGLAGLLLATPHAGAQHRPLSTHASPPGHASGHAPEGACEIRPDAPYVNPRLPLGRAAYAHRPACRTTWASGPAGAGGYVQGPPVLVDAPPVSVGGLRIYLVPPEIIVRPSEVTVEPPQILSAPAAADPVETPGD